MPSKYWNWRGTDPMPEVAEFYYPLVKKVNNSIPDEEWENDRCKGIDEHGRYWNDVTFFHIGHMGPEDPHVCFGKDEHGYYVGIETLIRDAGDFTDFWKCPLKKYFRSYVPEDIMFNTDFACGVLTIFAYGQKGWRKKIKDYVENFKKGFCDGPPKEI